METRTSVCHRVRATKEVVARRAAGTALAAEHGVWTRAADRGAQVEALARTAVLGGQEEGQEERRRVTMMTLVVGSS